MWKRRKTLRPALCNAGGEPFFDPLKGPRVPRHGPFAPVNFELWPKCGISNMVRYCNAALLCLCIFFYLVCFVWFVCLVYLFVVFKGCSSKCSPRWCRHTWFWRLAVFPLAKFSLPFGLSTPSSEGFLGLPRSHSLPIKRLGARVPCH